RPVSHPDPHSFPTRRSSDLKSAVKTPPATAETPPATDAASAVQDKGRGPFFTRLTGRVASWRDRITGRPHQDMRSQFHAWMAKADRKSTRLNSSHGSISYAV